MRESLFLSALIAVLGLAGAAAAEPPAAEKSAEGAPPAVGETAERTPGAIDLEALLQGVPHDACFGDRYESDQDLNEGNTISVDEILRLINPSRV